MGERSRTMQKRSEPKQHHGVSEVKKTNLSSSKDVPVEQVLHLQRTIGNRAVTHLIESGMIQAQKKVSIRMANVGGGESFDTRFSVRSSAPPSHKKTVGSSIAGLISRSSASHTLPENVRRQFAQISGDDLSEVRVHDDNPAHEAARQLGAHAFTIGRSIYFGADRYRPATLPGKHLLAHEVAHTIQQRNASVPSFQNLTISPSTDVHETEADRFADSAINLDANPSTLTLTPMTKVARLQRAVSFTRSNDSFTTNSMGVRELAGGFQIYPKGIPLFEWKADVTINGSAGDPCNQYEVGPLQLVRHYWHNVWWGTGRNRTHRKCKLSTLPIRDAIAAGNTWYHDPYAKSFSTCGQTQNTGLDDSPQSQLHPWNNPVAGRASTRGWFNYGVAFVAYISARDKRKGTGAGAFQPLGHVYWNTMLNGSFNTTRPVGSRVNYSGGRLNRSRVFAGGSSQYPSMHGGPIANNSHSCTDK